MSLWNKILKYGRNKQVLEGARFHQEHFELPFKQNMNLLAAMFETRKWFIMNTPHKSYAEKYTNEMAFLHNELNYQHAKLILRRVVIVCGLLFAYKWFINEPDALDWKDSFDIKFQEKSYGSFATASGEGGISMDD